MLLRSGLLIETIPIVSSANKAFPVVPQLLFSGVCSLARLRETCATRGDPGQVHSQQGPRTELLSPSPSKGLGREGQASYRGAFKNLIKGRVCIGSAWKRCGYLQVIFLVSASQRARALWLTDPMWSGAAELPGTLQPPSRQRQL